MAINAIGNGIPFPRGEGIPSAVRDSMVLWYDLKRQGATNESMAANPKLKDLSGNGHDTTCYNFAWSGMSGIGGFPFSFNDSFLGDNEIIINSRTENNISFVSSSINSWQIGIDKSKYNNISYQLYLKGDKNGRYTITLADENYKYVYNQEISKGFNTIKPFPDEYFNKSSYIYLETPTNAVISCRIEPLYPNALVSDGVDDYAYVEGLPLLTDYTVIAKRNYIEINKDTCLASKSTSAGVGAFIFEEKHSTNLPTVYSFGKATAIQINENKNEIVYMTPISYNGLSINKGGGVDTNTLYLGTLRNDTRKFNGALYSFILFNHTLTTKEINWVKENLIEGDIEL